MLGEATPALIAVVLTALRLAAGVCNDVLLREFILDLAPDLHPAACRLGWWPGLRREPQAPVIDSDPQVSQIMITAPEIRKLTSLSSDARQAATTAFESLEEWRDEISSVNERHLTKVFDQVASLQRAMGWPDQFTIAAKEHLTSASRMQTDMIDQVMEAWEHGLKSSTIPSGLSESFKFQVPALFGPGFTDPVSEMMRLQELTLAPFKLWIHAAEMWQRNWAGVMSTESRPSRSTRTPSS